MAVARHHPLSRPVLRGQQLCWVHSIWNWSPMLRKRELGVLFSAVFLYFLLALVCAVIHDTAGWARRQAGWQDGRHPGSHNDTPITMYPKKALLLHVSWFVLTYDCAFPNDRSLDVCMHVSPCSCFSTSGEACPVTAAGSRGRHLDGRVCMGPSPRRLCIDPDLVTCSRAHWFDIDLTARFRGCLACYRPLQSDVSADRPLGRTP